MKASTKSACGWQAENRRSIMKIVVALGGNALLQPRRAADRRHPARACRRRDGRDRRAREQHNVVVTHGNGPQVGLLALQATAYTEVPAYPLDVLGAESEGMIGYVLEQELENRAARAPRRHRADPGRRRSRRSRRSQIRPSRSARSTTRQQARELAAERGWTIAPDNQYFRRVVASPQPLKIVELSAIRLLVDSGALVVCTGGGGIPVVARRRDGFLTGVEAVIDKDLAASCSRGASMPTSC